MDHVITVNPYLNQEGEYTPKAEKELQEAIEAQHAAQQAEIDRKLEEAQEQVDANNAKRERETEEERERQAVENAEAREVREYETILKENNLDHVRQPNESPENYVEIPKDINVTDNDVHNDGELDGEFGRYQTLEMTSLDEVIAQEEEARQAAIAARYEVIDTPGPAVLPEGFSLPAPSTKE